MAWVLPGYSRERVNAAGKTLATFFHQDAEDVLFDGATSRDLLESIDVLNNWRSAHGYPLNTFQINLRNVARRFDTAPLIAQRTKRLASITQKLYRLPKMKLTQMQDIGGCRAIVASAHVAQQIGDYYLRESKIKHSRASVDDYILKPKASGYRGIHLVYRYESDKPGKLAYNDLKIELQIRSKHQHAWATAVETVGTFVNEALKSSVGSDEWLRFFVLMSSAIALKERRPMVPGTPENSDELLAELRELAIRLNVHMRLSTYGSALRRINSNVEQLDAKFYLLKLEPLANKLTVTSFGASEAARAAEAYAEAEKSVTGNPGTDVVLVSVESLAALEKAYPNYFADTRVFLGLLEQVAKGNLERLR